MTDEYICPCCQCEMTLHIDSATYKRGFISVKYERFTMKCECGEESQTSAQRIASHRSALRAYYNRRELIGIICVGGVMAAVLTSIFIGCA